MACYSRCILASFNQCSSNSYSNHCLLTVTLLLVLLKAYKHLRKKRGLHLFWSNVIDFPIEGGHDYMGRLYIWQQGNVSQSRKQVAPLLREAFTNWCDVSICIDMKMQWFPFLYLGIMDDEAVIHSHTQTNIDRLRILKKAAQDACISIPEDFAQKKRKNHAI